MLFVVGFLLIFIEVVIIPGFGFAGIIGAAALFAACYNAFTGLSPLAGIITTVGSIVVIIGLFKILPRTSFWKKTRLALSQRKSMGYQVANPELKNLLHKTGTSLTMLRPSGTVLINNQHYDVITDGEFIEKDVTVKVIEVAGNKIVVRKVQ
jgi:membrane-bound serine protease (ClpP class)